MGLGRRSAPTAPPIPSRPLPPSAYGIAVPGAPLSPGQQHAPPPPPPPAAAPAPSPFVDYAVTPSANPYAAPSSFGAPPSTFGAPPVGYGTPAWSNVPPKKRRSLLWAKVLGGVFVGLIGIGVLVHLYDAATKHYVTTLPASLQGLDQDDSALSQQAIAAATAQATSDGGLREVTNFQVGVYRSGSTIVVADMGNIPANSGAFRNQLLNSIVGSDASATFTSVTPGKQGGSESCGVVSDHEVCVWLDNGTMGFVFFNQPDQETTMSLLQSLRDATEH